jgi:hypothetical protein
MEDNKLTEKEEFQKAMIEILGKEAFYSTSFNISDNAQKLASVVYYLYGQLDQCKYMINPDDRDYIDELKKNVIEILNGR